MLLTVKEYLDRVARGEEPFRKSVEARTDKLQSDYFEKLGALVEEHSLGRPISSRVRQALNVSGT